MSTSLKKRAKGCAAFLISAALGAFAVVLLGNAFKGDPYAITLAIAELLLFVTPFWIDETKMPKWLESTWMLCAKLWFPLTGLWLLHLINII